MPLADLPNMSANSKLLGSSATGAESPPSEITLGTNLAMSGSTLNATGVGGGPGNRTFGRGFSPTFHHHRGDDYHHACAFVSRLLTQRLIRGLAMPRDEPQLLPTTLWLSHRR